MKIEKKTVFRSNCNVCHTTFTSEDKFALGEKFIKHLSTHIEKSDKRERAMWNRVKNYLGLK